MHCSDLLRKIIRNRDSFAGDLRSLYKLTKDVQELLKNYSYCHVLLRRTLNICKEDLEAAKRLFRFVPSFKARGEKFDVEKDAVDLYRFAFEEVGHYWKELGASLGFRKRELDDIEYFHASHRQGVNYMAWAMLEKYRAKNEFRFSSIELLRRKLGEVQRRRRLDVPQNEREITDLLPGCIIDDGRFYGREEELGQIANYLWNGKAKQSRIESVQIQRIQIIAGVGGVGKTSLAFKYALQYAKSYSDGLFYFNSESFASFLVWLRENVVKAVELSGLHDAIAMTSHADALRVFFRYLRSRPRSLLLLDNADDFDFLKRCLPGHAVACHVVITTRRTQTHDVFHERNASLLTLNVLDEQRAVVALLRLAGMRPESQATMDYNEKKYAEKVAVGPPVGGLPLALSHAGSFIEHHRITFRQYWMKLEAEAKRLEAAAFNLDTFLRYFHLSHLRDGLDRCGVHSVNAFVELDLEAIGLNAFDRKSAARARMALATRERVFLTWEMDLDDVFKDNESNGGYRFLEVCSVLSSQNIPLDLVADAAFSTTATVAEFRVMRALKALNERSLVQRISETDNESMCTFAVHHLVQASVLQRLGHDVGHLQWVLESTAKALFKRLPPPDEFLLDFTDPSLLHLAPHVYSVAEKMLEAGLLVAPLVDYSCALAMGFYHYDDAVRLCSLRTEVFEAMSATFSSEEIRLLRHNYYFPLARLYYGVDNWHEGDVRIRKALGERRVDELSNSELRYYRRVLYILAESQVERKMLDDAEVTLLRLLDAYPSETKTSEALHNAFMVFLRLGNLYQESCRFEKERVVLKKAIHLGNCGLFHPGIQLACCYQKLAECLVECRELDEALKYFFQALKAFKKIIPDGHAAMGILRLDIAGCLRDKGELSKACEFSWEALSILKSTYSPEHPQLKLALRVRGHCLLISGRFEESSQVFKEWLSSIELGPHQPDYLSQKATCLEFLGDALRGSKTVADCVAERNDEVIRCYEEAVALFRKAYPNGHRDMITACTAVSSAYGCAGRMDEALEFAKLAWNSTESLPTGCEDRITSLTVYVQYLSIKGKFTEAELLLAQGKAECNCLPRYHPSRRWLRGAEAAIRECKLDRSGKFVSI